MEERFSPAGGVLIEIMLLVPKEIVLPCTRVNFRARPGNDSTSSLNLEFSGFEGIPKAYDHFPVFFFFHIFFSFFSGDSL